MPTPMRLGGQGSRGGTVVWCNSIAPPKGVRRELGREGPPLGSDEEEACDERSLPQDVTSPWVRDGGINLQQEVSPQQTERPPRDSSEEDSPDRTPGLKCNIQPDGAGHDGNLGLKVSMACPAGELCRSPHAGGEDVDGQVKSQTDA